jgi:hypothetical protein
MKQSKALKSTLVRDAYEPGQIVLKKRLRESCAMMTLSTTITESLILAANLERAHYRSHCSRIR